MSDATRDDVPVILARMEAKLDSALTEQARHTSTLDRHEAAIVHNGNRLTSLETAAAALSANTRSRLGVWPAWASAIVSGAALAVLLLKDLYT